MASTRPSFPAPSEPNLKRLGLGGSGGPDRPLRAQLVVAGVAVLVLLTIPLYLLKSPGNDQAADPETSSTAQPKAGLIRTVVDAGAPKSKVVLGPIERVRCSAAPDRKGNEGTLCDALPQLEKALLAAIEKNVGCAPQTGQEGSINFVMTVDFKKQRLHVFAGASGQWKGPQAKTAAKCVRQDLPEVAWDTLVHRYRYYVLAVLATYPAPEPSTSLPAFE